MRCLLVIPFAAYSLALLVGCGAAKADVRGKVFLEDKKLAMGSVTFIDKDGTPHSGSIGEDGSYSIRGLAVGEARVTVMSKDPSLKPVKKERPEMDQKNRFNDKPPPKKPPEKGPRDPRWFQVPDEYGNPAAPLLTFTVKTGDNEIDIKMSNAPKKS